MDLAYLDYALADPHIFVAPGDAGEQLSAQVPNGWDTSNNETWRFYSPAAQGMVPQGWKVHVSTVPDRAQETLRVVAEYCFGQGLAFKHLKSMRAVRANNSKYAARSSSGKFIAIYPQDDEALQAACHALGVLLRDFSGPRVLSDLKWPAGPVHVRYGGFVKLLGRPAGAVEDVPCIRGERGELVEDVRAASFRLPSFVKPPPLVADLIGQLGADKGVLPFLVKGAIQFSNGGGVYEGTYQDRPAVIKEARPLAAIDGFEHDAVYRLRRERDALMRLKSVAGVPDLLGYVTVWEHEFLIMERVEGRPLGNYIANRYPLTSGAGSTAEWDYYRSDIAVIMAGVERTLGQVHELGCVAGDLSPNNILVGDDCVTHLIDWEGGGLLEGFRKSLTTPGFGAPPHLSPQAQDLFSLERIRLHCQVPLSSVLEIAPELEAAHRNFAESGCRWQVESPRQGSSVCESHASERRSLAAGVAHGISALWRKYQNRSWPLSVEGLQGSNRLSMWTGLGGVVASLRRAGVIDEELEGLYVAGLRHERDLPLGLMGGAHGHSLVLRDLGRLSMAEHVGAHAARAADQQLDQQPPLSLFHGLSGWVLAALIAAESGCDWATEGHLARLGQRLALTVEHQLVATSTARTVGVGLLNGWSGVALAVDMLGVHNGDASLHDLAWRCLEADLARCERDERTSSLQVRDGDRLLPYLGAGSAGILAAAAAMHNVPRSADVLPQLLEIGDALVSPFYICCGLSQGRAGTAFALGQLASINGHETRISQAHEQLSLLRLHLVSRDGVVLVPGDHNLRFSTDVATGAAGVLSYLTSDKWGAYGWLPIQTPDSFRSADTQTLRAKERRTLHG